MKYLKFQTLYNLWMEESILHRYVEYFMDELKKTLSFDEEFKEWVKIQSVNSRETRIFTKRFAAIHVDEFDFSRKLCNEIHKSK